MSYSFLRAYRLAASAGNNAILRFHYFRLATFYSIHAMRAKINTCHAADAFIVVDCRKPFNLIYGYSIPFYDFFIHFLSRKHSVDKT